MRYWDSSALVTLIVREAATGAMESLLAADPVIITWWGSRVECASALARLERESQLGASEAIAAAKVLAEFREGWRDVLPSDVVRESAERMVRTHPLRAADAFQLASALVASDFRPATMAFVSRDQRLLAAARREGFA
ncbi:MAG: type II toxin-antitoxin system VapC family toxin [Gemmatimonadales bacterium]